LIIYDGKLTVGATGVTESIVNISEKYASVPTARVHHLKYRIKVFEEGADLNFKWYQKGERSAWRATGQLPYYNHFVIVDYERTAKGTSLYIYQPQMDLSGGA
jgi:hypothetical protein